MIRQAVRIHPAVLAQAAATAAVQHEGRFVLGVGSGEALNARIYTLPDKPVPIYLSAFGPKAMKLAGRLADGLISVKPDASLVLPTPRHLEQAASLVTPEMTAESVPCGPDPERYVQAVRAFADAGFDAVHVQQIGPEQDAFFEFWAEQVAPRLTPVGV